jgi:hypothetical protein
MKLKSAIHSRGRSLTNSVIRLRNNSIFRLDTSTPNLKYTYIVGFSDHFKLTILEPASAPFEKEASSRVVASLIVVVFNNPTTIRTYIVAYKSRAPHLVYLSTHDAIDSF